MAYGSKYKIGYYTPADSEGNPAISQTVYIKELDYSGAVEDLEGTAHGLSIIHNWDNWETHILGTTCEFDIVNDKANYFELLDLMFATDKKYLVVVDGGSQGILFEGFVNVEASEQKYLHKQTIKLVASSYLARLELIEFPFSEALTTLSFIDIIDGILRETGIEKDIWISHSWYNKETVPEVGKTTFNTTGIFLETFWENNVEKQNGFEIISEILKTFNSYLFYKDEHWYILEYDLIWDLTRDYVIYTTGVSYNPTSTGGTGTINSSVRTISSLVFTRMSQNLKAQPGYKQIEIKTDLQKFDNLVLNDFSVPVSTSITNPIPLTRHWLFYREFGKFTWSEQGEPFNTITNSAKRTLTEDPVYHQKGLYTQFQVTIDDTNSLSLEWKQTVYLSAVIDWTKIVKATIEVKFYYYLRVLNYIDDSNEYYIKFIDDDSYKWYIMSGSAGGALNEIKMTFTKEQAFDSGVINLKYFITEIATKIPLNEINKFYSGGSELRGNYNIVLGIGEEWIDIKAELSDSKIHVPHGFADQMWIGDIMVSTTGDTAQDNLLRGTINKDFVNIKKLELKIGDIPNVNYKNGILTGYSAGEYEERTTAWARPSAALFVKPIDEMIMLDKWRQYNTAKQILTGVVFQNPLLSILQLLIEEKQSDKKYVLMGYIYKPTKGMYDVILMEYDNETVINLI